MLGVYRLLAYCAVLPVLVYLWWRGRLDPHYRLRWRERFAWPSGPVQVRGAVVLHCASVGEVMAARALIEQLLANPRFGPLMLTCSTPTGSRLIQQDYQGRVAHQYFPLDLPGATRRFLSALQPRLVILLEREIWPGFLRQAQLLGVPVALVNARLSARSAANYSRWHGLMMPTLATLRLVCAEDAITAARLVALGVAPQRLKITGNIKSDIRLEPALLHKIAAVRQLLGQRPVLTAGSTHAGEDEALLAAFIDHLEKSPRTLLILVPRHPERFAVVHALLERSGLRFARHSLAQPPGPDIQVMLGDTMGELLLWYGVANACFVGGSLVGRGGHNPLEVLSLAKPLIAGAHTANFASLYAAMQDADAMLPAADAASVFGQFRTLLQDPHAAANLAARGHLVYQGMAGASARTLAQLQPFLVRMAAGGGASPAVARHGRDLIWFDPQCFDDAPLQLFDPGRARRAAGSAKAGRGEVHWVVHQQRTYLLRHYYRGGMMAKLSRDLFLAQPVARSRGMREFTLLAQLRARGLPVPRAGAARRSGYGFWYRSDVLLEKIPDALDVAEILHVQRALTNAEWMALGRTLRDLHDEQVFHSDLNCHNLMLDVRGKAWVVDFDKCGFRGGDEWKPRNLERLLRSLRKELRIDPAFRWSERDWPHFLAGYAPQPDDS